MPFTLAVFLVLVAELTAADKTIVPGQAPNNNRNPWPTITLEEVQRRHAQVLADEASLEQELKQKERWLAEHHPQEHHPHSHHRPTWWDHWAKEHRHHGLSGGFQNVANQPHHVQAMRSLFPGPLRPDMGMKAPMPFAQPDPFVLDMMAHLSGDAQESIMSGMHEVPSNSQAPASCQQDLLKHCPQARSQVQCLGQYGYDVSEPCRRDVGASVPFLCHEEISRFCDVHQQGVLGCLQRNPAQLSRNCHDAVAATAIVLDRLNVRAPRPDRKSVV